MRGGVTLVLLTAASLLLACERKPAPPGKLGPVAEGVPVESLPRRRPGLWEQTVTATKGAMSPRPITSQICLNEAADQAVSLFGENLSNLVCTQRSFMEVNARSYEIRSQCRNLQGGQVVTSGIVGGDFVDTYEAKTTIETTGSRMQAQNGTMNMSVSAHWLGPCPQGFSPGDIALDNGLKVNLLDKPGLEAAHQHQGGRRN